MVTWFKSSRCSPIGIDIGSRSIKLVQFDAARSELRETARWDLSPNDDVGAISNRPNAGRLEIGPTGNADAAGRDAQIIEAIRQARQGRKFRGSDAVLCLGAGSLFVQNIRVAPANGDELGKIVSMEAAGRLPFSSEEAEIRFLHADDIRQGDAVRREMILMASHRPVIQRLLTIAESAGLRPVAIDAEPMALLRCYVRQFRRDDDQQRRRMFVNVGASTTQILIARDGDPMFVKYIELGGRHFDEAVARNLKMSASDATALRRHNGDRRADQRDPDIARSIGESVRPVLERLAQEISLCLRYYSVTFRGQPLEQVVLTGGEANASLQEWLGGRIDVPCELGNPLRSFQKAPTAGRVSQWDVAAGLALREIQ